MATFIAKTNDILFYLMIAYIFVVNLSIKELNDIVFTLLFILFIINVYYNRHKLDILPRWIFYSVGLFCLTMLILSLISPNIQESFKIVRRLIKYIIPFLIIFYCINDRKKIQILFITLLGSIFIEIIYALMVSSSNFYDIIFNNMPYRMQGYPPEPGKWPTIMLLSMKLQVFLVSIYILLLDKRIHYNKIFLSIIFCISLIALFFNNTRMAWFIVFIMFILITCCYVRNIKRLFIILGITFTLLGTIIYNQPWIQTRINNAIHFQDGSSQLHYMFVKDSLIMIEEKPLLGWGIGQFSKYYNESFRSDKTNYLIEKYKENTPVPYAHNMVIDMMVECGIIGAIVYIVCYGSFLFFSIKDWYKFKSISALLFFSATLCFVLHGFSEKTLTFNVIVQYHYCLLGMYLVYRKYELERRDILEFAKYHKK